MSEKLSPGKQALVYHPAKVSWAAADFIRRPPAIAASLFVVALAVFLLGAATYSFFARVPVSVTASGRLTTEQLPFPVTASSSTTVVELKVTENQLVEAGDVLILTDNNIADGAYQSVKSQSADLLAALQKDRAGKCVDECLAKLTTLSRSAFTMDVPIGIKDTVVQIQDLLREFASAKTNLIASAALVAEQERQIRVAQAQLKVIQKRGAEKELASDVEQIKSKIGSLRSEVGDRKNTARVQVEQSRDRLEVRLKDLLPRVDEFRRNQALVAPEGGIIVDLAISGSGQKIGPGAPLMSIIPKKSLLVAEIDVSNRDIAKVKKGMPAKVRLEALPEREYGAVDGEVIFVAASPSAAKSAAEPQAYKVRVAMRSQSLTKAGVIYPFRFGMTLSTIVISKRERILTLALEKVFNLKDAAVGQ